MRSLVIFFMLQSLWTGIVIDVGKSLNPATDVGQFEGAFIHANQRSVFLRQGLVVAEIITINSVTIILSLKCSF